MKTVFRWIAVVPAAVGAYLGIQIVISLLAGISDFFTGMKTDRWTQLVNSVTSGWVIIWAGCATAPQKKFLVAIVLGAMHVIFSVGVVTIAFSGRPSWENWWLLICDIVGLTATVVAIVEVKKKEDRDLNALRS